MSDSEPETPKPNAVDQEVTNALDNLLKAENEKLRQEDAQTKRQYMDLLENSAATIGNLKKELEDARSQLATVQAENHQDYDQLLDSMAITIDNQRNAIRILQSRLREERDEDAEPKQQPVRAINLSDKAGEVADYLKTLLSDEKLLNTSLTKIKRNKPVQLPRDVISKVEDILSGKDKNPPTDARELLNEG